MNREALLQQISEWHEENENQKIIDAIETLPREEWGYEMTGLLARAYNNLAMMGETTPEEAQAGLLEKAVSLLESMEEDGKDDAVWHYRLGYSLFYLNREEEALPHFRQAVELDPDDSDTRLFIHWCEHSLSSKKAAVNKSGAKSLDKQTNSYYGESQNVYGETEEAAPSGLAEVMMSYLGCECWYFPPMSDSDPIMEAYRLAAEEGFIPVLIAVDETLWECLLLNSDPDNDSAKEYGFDPKAVAAYRKEQLSRPVPDGKAVLDRLIGDRREEAEEDDIDWEELLGEMSGEEDEDLGELLSIWDDATRKTHPLILAKIPVQNPWEIFTYLPFGGWNECPDTQDLMAVAKHWYQRYGAVPAAMTHDDLEFLVPAPVDEEQAMELAVEQYGCCPNIIYQAEEDLTVGVLADHLHSCKVWYFWWD